MTTPSEISVPYGYCHCGCGNLAPLAKKNSRLRSHVKGEPIRFIPAHINRKTPIIEVAQPFKIDGIYCRLIPLTKGLWTIVDAADYEWLMQWKWYAHYSQNTRCYYVQRMERCLDGKQHTVHMHRMILGLDHNDPSNSDHRNRCGIDNRRKNLRSADDNENAQNVGLRQDNISGVKGITWHKDSKTWLVRVQCNKIRKHVGYFKEFEKARVALIEATKALHGEFANFS